MTRSFDIVDAATVKTDEGDESHRALHGTDNHRSVWHQEGSTCPPWPLVDVVIPRRYHPFADAQNNAGPGVTGARRLSVVSSVECPPPIRTGPPPTGQLMWRGGQDADAGSDAPDESKEPKTTARVDFTAYFPRLTARRRTRPHAVA
jgi:hypothetical protein